MRGTLKGTEVERWGSEQARRYQAGSLNPSKASTIHEQLSNLLPLFFLCFGVREQKRPVRGGVVLLMSFTAS